MPGVTLYSRSRRPGPGDGRPATDPRPAGIGGARGALSGSVPTSASASARRRSWPRPSRRLGLALAGAVGLLVALATVFSGGRTSSRPVTQEEIDAAVLHALSTRSWPSRAARAYQVIRPSVVRVRGWHDDAARTEGENVGTGVVIVDRGTILTNLHVVAGARRVEVTFADGQESEATLAGAQPENDLAVLQARTVPDDLVPATLRSTRDLAPGDEVVAVGFPFGIGPSASAGVISGLRREFRSPRRQHVLTNLIQFDAAANPGNSGGPLVTMDGEVVGIVTAILNPTEQRVFVGIGFAVPIENAAAAAGLSPF